MELENCRKEIDEIDKKLTELFIARMKVSERIADIKKENALPVFNAEREKEVKENAVSCAPDDMKDYVAQLYDKIFELSKRIQNDR